MTDPERMERLGRLVCEHFTDAWAREEGPPVRHYLPYVELRVLFTEGAEHAAERIRGLDGEVGEFRCVCEDDGYGSNSKGCPCWHHVPFPEALGALWGAVMRTAEAMETYALYLGEWNVPGNQHSTVRTKINRRKVTVIESLNVQHAKWLGCKEAL